MFGKGKWASVVMFDKGKWASGVLSRVSMEGRIYGNSTNP
jgi:hypothetical protein